MGAKKLFAVRMFKNPKAKGNLFYLAGYKFPWWIYWLQVKYFQKKGYTVFVYSFNNKVLEDHSVTTLPETVSLVSKDIARRINHGLQPAYGIGNSLGSYMLFNAAKISYFEAIVCNSGGSVADTMFYARTRALKKNARYFQSIGFTPDTLRLQWSRYDSANNMSIKAKRICINYSKKDGTIPPHSTEEFINELRKNHPVTVHCDTLPHILSVYANSWRLRKSIQFLTVG